MRFGLVSDIHSNLVALEAALNEIEAMGPVDGLLCMGDIVGYGPQPNEVIERLRSLDYTFFSILGNHDLGVLGKLDLNDFNFDAIEANQWNRDQLKEGNREWLDQLKPMGVFNEEITLAHGSPFEPIWEYLIRPQEAARSFDKFETNLCFVGHTHLPRLFRFKSSSSPSSGNPFPRLARLVKSNNQHPKTEMIIPQAGEELDVKNGRYIINPGSVGQPRDGDNRASFAVYDDKARTVTFGRVAYDISLTQQLMAENNLPQRLILRLDYGL